MHLLDVPVQEDTKSFVSRISDFYSDGPVSWLPQNWTKHQLQQFFGNYYTLTGEIKNKRELIGEVSLESVDINRLSNVNALCYMCKADARKGWPNGQALIKRVTVLLSDFLDHYNIPNTMLCELNHGKIHLPKGLIGVFIDNGRMVFNFKEKDANYLATPKKYVFALNSLQTLKKLIL